MKFTFLAVGLTFLSVSNASAQADQRFNLRCVGSAITERGGTSHDGPWSGIFHIDLVSRHWCTSTCFYIKDIADVTPDEIKLSDSANSSNMNLESIDRRTGAYNGEMVTSLGSGFSIKTHAMCDKVPFTGFPSRKF